MDGSAGEVARFPPDQGPISRQRVLPVPVADIRPFGKRTVLFNFDFVPAKWDVQLHQPSVVGRNSLQLIPGFARSGALDAHA